MPTTAKKTKSTKTTKVKPAKKPAAKPASTSVKPKQYKTVKAPAKSTKVEKSSCRGCGIFFGIIMIVLALAMIADVIVHIIVWLSK